MRVMLATKAPPFEVVKFSWDVLSRCLVCNRYFLLAQGGHVGDALAIGAELKSKDAVVLIAFGPVHDSQLLLGNRGHVPLCRLRRQSDPCHVGGALHNLWKSRQVL